MRQGKPDRVKIFLLPLGGGVFNNSWESIGRAMAQAAELMTDHPNLFNKLEIEALAWSGNPQEKMDLERELSKYQMLFNKDGTPRPKIDRYPWVYKNIRNMYADTTNGEDLMKKDKLLDVLGKIGASQGVIE